MNTGGDLMKYLDEYRDPAAARKFCRGDPRQATRPWTIMEVCGGQTHTIVRYGIDELLPPEIELVHGPGCPVCVTPLEMIDRAIEIARRPEVIFCSFGDMLRVPGSRHDLLRREGARGRRADRLFAAGCLKIAAGESRANGGLLRRRLRNDGSGQRDGRLAGQAARDRRISPCWCRTCWCRRR